MNRQAQLKKGCLRSPKKLRIKGYIEEEGGSRVVSGHFEYPRRSRIYAGKCIQLPGLNHAIPVTKVNTFHHNGIEVWLRASSEAIDRLLRPQSKGRKRRWNPL